jgi:hypothetical protein
MAEKRAHPSAARYPSRRPDPGDPLGAESSLQHVPDREDRPPLVTRLAEHRPGTGRPKASRMHCCACGATVWFD